MIEILEESPVKETNQTKATLNRQPKKIYFYLYGLIIFLLFSGTGVFVSNWANLKKSDKEILYQNLLERQKKGDLHQDSVSILCKLAKELKKDIPKICTEQKVHKKTSGKNGSHSNLKRKESAKDKMLFWKNKQDSLSSLPNKTKAINQELQKAKSQYKKFKKQADDTGESHSRNAKGN
jgi:bisphosphoglycerate-dependent phosphoglycerate mutase